MQMLSGVITESKYKERLEEIGHSLGFINSEKNIYKTSKEETSKILNDPELKKYNIAPSGQGIIIADTPKMMEYIKNKIENLLGRELEAAFKDKLEENEEKIKISKKKLAKIISEEIVRFKKKSLLENRLREIDKELRKLDKGSLFESNLPSVSPEALLEPLENIKEKVEKDFNSFIDGVELIELTLWVEEMLFGVEGAKEGTGYDGLLAKKFPEIFSKEAMERYKGKEIDNYFLPIERENLWLKLIEPIALHYGYGFDGPNYSKIKAAKMALERGKKYVIAQYMS